MFGTLLPLAFSWPFTPIDHKGWGILISSWLVVVFFAAIGFVLDEINRTNQHFGQRRSVALLAYAAIGLAGLYFIYKTKAIWLPHFSY